MSAPPRFRRGAVAVRVPATSANLGPGYDTLGLALGLHDDLAVRVADAGLLVDVVGEGAEEVPRDERHLVVRAMRAAFAALGGQPPGLELVSENRVPHSRGLGSSAAAIVAGVLAARALVVPGTAAVDAALADDGWALRVATALEGHPDNVAACLLGGLTVAWTGPTGPVAVRLEPHAGLEPVVLVPTTTASTAEVRGLLPPTVPHADAAANAGRAALLVHALTARPELALPATEDRLHQPYRAPAMPATAALVAALRAEGVAAVVSGAGPTVLALPVGGQTATVERLRPAGWTLLRPGVDARGGTATPRG